MPGLGPTGVERGIGVLLERAGVGERADEKGQREGQGDYDKTDAVGADEPNAADVRADRGCGCGRLAWRALALHDGRPPDGVPARNARVEPLLCLQKDDGDGASKMKWAGMNGGESGRSSDVDREDFKPLFDLVLSGAQCEDATGCEMEVALQEAIDIWNDSANANGSDAGANSLECCDKGRRRSEDVACHVGPNRWRQWRAQRSGASPLHAGVRRR